MLKLKEEILSNATNSGSNSASTGTSTGSNPNSAGTNPGSNPSSTTTMPSSNAGSTKDIYMYGVGSLEIIAVGLCVFFYNFKGKPQQSVQQAEQQTKKIRQTL